MTIRARRASEWLGYSQTTRWRVGLVFSDTKYDNRQIQHLQIGYSKPAHAEHSVPRVGTRLIGFSRSRILCRQYLVRIEGTQGYGARRYDPSASLGPNGKSLSHFTQKHGLSKLISAI